MALILSGPYPLALFLVGIWQIGGAYWPDLFNVDPPGDSAVGTYTGDAWLIAVPAVILSGALLQSLLQAARGTRGARRLVMVWLTMLLGAVPAALSLDSSRRCVVDDYTQVEVCQSALTAAARDGVIFGVPAVVAVVLWWSIGERDRRSADDARLGDS